MAAGGLPGCCATLSAADLRSTGQGPARLYRIFPPQSSNAPLRLRLAAHPPPLAGEALGKLPPGRLPCKGLRSRAPPAADTARRSRCSGRRTQVCFSTRSAMRAPQTGNVGVSRLRGAAPGLANTLPGSADPPGGRERPPYNARQAGGEIGAADCRTHWHRGRGLAIGPAVRAGAGRSRTGGGACPQR